MLGVEFHHFHEDDAEKTDILPGSISKTEFYVLIEEIRKHYNILNAPDWCVQCIGDNAHDSNSLCLTFDDNIRSQFTVAREVLLDLDLTGFYFIYTGMFHKKLPRLELYRYFITKYFDNFDAFFEAFLDLLEENTDLKICDLYDRFPDNYLIEYDFYTKNERLYRYLRDNILKEDYKRLMDILVSRYTSLEGLAENVWLTKKQIHQLSNEGNIIGLHSLSHYTDLSNMPDEVQKEEYEANKKDLEEVTRQETICASYPNGSFNAYTLSLMRQLGIHIGFTSYWKSESGSILEMPRMSVSVMKKRLKIGVIA